VSFVGHVDNGSTGFKDTYEINCDDATIPGNNTQTGNAIHVTDGKFYFTKMALAPNLRLRFRGTHPPLVNVRGRCDIQGEIDLHGGSLPYLTVSPGDAGQPGGRGGAFGGDGGNGGDKCPGVGPAPAFNGRNGVDCSVPSGHAYSGNVAGTGGHGSQQFPADGLTGSLVFTTGSIGICFGAAAGGGGGGYTVAGGIGRVVFNSQTNPDGSGNGTATGPNTATTLTDPTKTWTTNQWAGLRVQVNSVPSQTRTVTSNTATQLTVDPAWSVIPTTTTTYQLPRLDQIGPPAAGGVALPSLLPLPPGARSSLHFLVGGAGGGGAGSQPLFCFRTGTSPPANPFSFGSGGGGGGGAIALRAGDRLLIEGTASVLVFGGSAGAAPTSSATGPLAAVGGGGSGGSVLLQTGREAQIVGLIDARGGARGTCSRASALTPGSCETNGGTGANGFIRLEVPSNPSTTLLPNSQPPATAGNVDLLLEQEPRSGFQTLYYSTNLPFGPTFRRYEIRALVNGQQRMFSDDAAASDPAWPLVGPAKFTSGPLQTYFQAVTIDLTTQVPVPNTERPWRQNVGSFNAEPALADDALNGFRFQILVDRTAGDTIVINSIKVIYDI